MATVLEAVDAIPKAEAVAPRFEMAAQLLEKAVAAGSNDPNVLYMLAIAHKRQGKTQEARNALRKIKAPDANVLAQLALLSLIEGNMLQAEGELQRAWEADKDSYEICYNLLLTQLTLAKVEPALSLIPRAIELLEKESLNFSDNKVHEERRFLLLLRALLMARQQSNQTDYRFDPLLSELTPAEEQRLLKVIRSLGQLEIVHTLLQTLSQARPRSIPVREAYVEAVLVKAKDAMDRCNWTEADLLLRPLAGERGVSRANLTTLYNLLGCCACLTQDFLSALRYFNSALKLAPNDARLHQNAALTLELSGDLAEADPHWNRFFDLVNAKTPTPPGLPNYLDNLAYEALSRLAVRYTEREKWPLALSYMQRAARVRPNDPDTLERLFHLYNHAKKPQDARRTLEQLRRLRPKDPQLDLYELDLVEVKDLTDIERLLSDIDTILKRFPHDDRVKERAIGMVGNVIPIIGSKCDSLTEHMSKVIDQVRHLPNYQINWSAVRDVMRDLLKEFQKLRRIIAKCIPLVVTEEHRRIIRDLADHIDKKIEACRSMGA